MPAQVDVLLAKPVDNVVKANKERQALVFRDKAGCTYDGLLQSSGPKPTDLTVYVSGTYCEDTKTSNSLVKYEIPMGPWTNRVTLGTHFTAYRLDKSDQRVSTAPVVSSADAARDANRAKFCQAYRDRPAAGAKPIPQAEAQCAQDKSWRSRLDCARACRSGGSLARADRFGIALAQSRYRAGDDMRPLI